MKFSNFELDRRFVLFCNGSVVELANSASNLYHCGERTDDVLVAFNKAMQFALSEINLENAYWRYLVLSGVRFYGGLIKRKYGQDSDGIECESFRDIIVQLLSFHDCEVIACALTAAEFDAPFQSVPLLERIETISASGRDEVLKIDFVFKRCINHLRQIRDEAKKV
jgi:hypothetical protein